jgi:hypothetical protein
MRLYPQKNELDLFQIEFHLEQIEPDEQRMKLCLSRMEFDAR